MSKRKVMSTMVATALVMTVTALPAYASGIGSLIDPHDPTVRYAIDLVPDWEDSTKSAISVMSPREHEESSHGSDSGSTHEKESDTDWRSSSVTQPILKTNVESAKQPQVQPPQGAGQANLQAKQGESEQEKEQPEQEQEKPEQVQENQRGQEQPKQAKQGESEQEKEQPEQEQEKPEQVQENQRGQEQPKQVEQGNEQPDQAGQGQHEKEQHVLKGNADKESSSNGTASIQSTGTANVVTDSEGHVNKGKGLDSYLEQADSKFAPADTSAQADQVSELVSKLQGNSKVKPLMMQVQQIKKQEVAVRVDVARTMGQVEQLIDAARQAGDYTTLQKATADLLGVKDALLSLSDTQGQLLKDLQQTVSGTSDGSTLTADEQARLSELNSILSALQQVETDLASYQGQSTTTDSTPTDSTGATPTGIDANGNPIYAPGEAN